MSGFKKKKRRERKKKERKGNEAKKILKIDNETITDLICYLMKIKKQVSKRIEMKK